MNKIDAAAFGHMALGLLGRDEPKVVSVWEVYKRDSQECALFRDEELARNSDVFEEVDLISQANVRLSKKDVQTLNEGKPVFI